MQDGVVADNLISEDIDLGVRPTPGAEKVEAIQGLQGSGDHANGAAIELGLSVVELVAALPDAKVWGAVGLLDVVNKVLHKVYLINGEDNLEAGGGHLG